MERTDGTDVLRLHRLIPRVTTLGPFVRLGVWTQGCLGSCPGCVTPEARPLTGGKPVTFDGIERLFLRFPEQEGLTVSGGEPFLQAAALCRLIDRLRARRDMGVIVYTGYTLDELQKTRAAENLALLDRIDLLIDGPYITALDDGGALRGSSNQRILPLTDRYRNCLDQYGPGRPRRTELRYTDDGFGLVGIPSKRRKEENGS